MFKARKELQDPKLRQRIVKLKNRGLGWKAISEAIYKEFKVNVSTTGVKSIYEKELALGLAKSGKARESFEVACQAIEERYAKAVKWVDKLGSAIDSIYDRYGQSSPELFIKYAPVILAVAREVLNQLEFLKREQERISIYQKNLIYSPIQIVNIVHKKLKTLEREGYIKILKKLPDKDEEDTTDTGAD